jgi:hypothetical protein
LTWIHIQGENKPKHKLSTVQYFEKIIKNIKNTYVLRWLGNNIINIIIIISKHLNHILPFVTQYALQALKLENCFGYTISSISVKLVKVKVKQSCHRPGVAQRVPGS